MKSDLVDVTVKLLHETDRAYLVTDDTENLWVPKSQCEIEADTNGTWTLTLPEWLAQEKGFV